MGATQGEEELQNTYGMHVNSVPESNGYGDENGYRAQLPAAPSDTEMPIEYRQQQGGNHQEEDPRQKQQQLYSQSQYSQSQYSNTYRGGEGEGDNNNGNIRDMFSERGGAAESARSYMSVADKDAIAKERGELLERYEYLKRVEGVKFVQEVTANDSPRKSARDLPIRSAEYMEDSVSFRRTVWWQSFRF